MRDDFLAGTIVYLRAREETGREWFERIVHHADGTATLRAYCEMDDAGVTRDVSYLLDRNSHPVDAFCRVTRHGALQGTALFLAEPERLRCIARTRDLGIVQQDIACGQGLAYLGLHPLVGDALAAQLRGVDAPGVFREIEGITNSHSPNGDEGLIGVQVAIDAAFVGRETVTVRAGTFETRRYALRWHPDWPAADLWVREEDALFVRMAWDMVAAEYELASLRTHR